MSKTYSLLARLLLLVHQSVYLPQGYVFLRLSCYSYSCQVCTVHPFFKSKTSILKWKRGQSTRSRWLNKTGYLSKFSQKAEPDPFCMNEPHLYTLVYGLCYERKEWFLLLAHLHIEVFDVGCTNPKKVLHGLHP